MGEYAEMMLDGTFCAGCGAYLHDPDPWGIPSYCSDDCAPSGFIGKVSGVFVEGDLAPQKKRAPARVRRSKGNMDSIDGNITALNKVVHVDPSAVDFPRLEKQIRRLEAMRDRITKRLGAV